MKRKSLKDKKLIITMDSLQNTARRFRVDNGCVYIS